MGVFVNIHVEIQDREHYEGNGLEIVKGRSKGILNTNHDKYYLDLVSFVNAMEISINKLLELISYFPIVEEYPAFYKKNQHKSIRVIEITGLNELIRGLHGLGYNLDLLKTIREQFYKLHEQITKKEINDGKN
ncbi:hypothetical protein [Metabacillus indicus]|uniref:hypothetical protein n=1 Tax=Metabacillus indicus TaxID=246786 RepID=UPI003CF1A064